eukprot:CAMPEP_0185359320 /NCGR_PEP_ID=MMETSP1364-20130426/8810_1 /TAXON_ID=38817 /ORGANISM="Gephyrocapsa oceanica, Strain RCC1303" /LENGTH=69 /DNA_ID=CAMNT_0027959503 /DNA_START=68 /DNA_END=273 /DNA_ORIENTATION=+
MAVIGTQISESDLPAGPRCGVTVSIKHGEALHRDIHSAVVWSEGAEERPAAKQPTNGPRARWRQSSGAV